MRKIVAAIAFVFSVFIYMPVMAEVPVCRLGGPTAMDTRRQLALGEIFMTTDRPLVVHLRFNPTKKYPESVGTCTLISGTVVAVKDSVLQWVKKCGNDEVNKNIFVTPFILQKGEKGDKGDMGLTGRDGKDGKNGRDGKNAEAISPSLYQWGLTGGISRSEYSGPIADRELCQIKSSSLNLGIVYGDANRFFGRLTIMGTFVDDGSQSSYVCSNCGTITTTTNGMKVVGGNLELVLLVGPKNWKVQPTIYAGGGGGVVLGKATRTVNKGSVTTVASVDASELLGYKKLQGHGGGGAGLTWHASPKISVEVSAKYTYPYGGSVGISLTKWFGK